METPAKFKPQEFEQKWQKIWEEKRVYQPDLKSAKRPFYNLMMFPYPSAEGLHVGNVYAFTGADIYGRFKRMQGYDVFEPIGLDGFGIHSENYAIKIGKHPAEQAKISQKNFYRQLHAIGNGFAWKNTLETYDPDYYRWTQWIFVQMFKHRLAYRKKSPVNFCPSCKTVLSDEQVIDGTCERCKTLVEKREMEQWFFKITKYAEKLLKNIETLQWTKKVKIGQTNWIGKSEGVMLRFKVKDMDIYFEMFDSVPQTFMAQTFTVIAPEHPRLYELVKGTQYEKPVMEFVEKITKKKATKKFEIEKETEGLFTGRYIEYTAANRLLPIWVASFVIADYGTGVVNASVHDERDFAFAKKYDLPLHPVMFPEDPKEAEKVKKLENCYHHAVDGILTEPQKYKGRKWGEVRSDIIDHIESHGWGKRMSQYHLRDWLISRQRYWGAPIPMVNCPKCGWVSVSEDQLPVLLPENVKDWKPEGTGKSPLAKIESFVNVKCPKCRGNAKRETDVCDTFLDSSWYHMRYPSVRQKRHSGEEQRDDSRIREGSWTSQNDNNLPWDPLITKKWLPVTQYIGGAEHTVLHLLYARFIAMAFKDFGYIDFEEPYTRFYAHGLIIAEGAKMSKSKGNIVNPDEYIKAYGADTLRTYLMFLGPFDHGGDFRDTGIAGMFRFLNRVWRLVSNVILTLSETKGKNPVGNSKTGRDPSTHPSINSGLAQDDSLMCVMHRTIKEVTEDMENLRYNTATAHIMEYVNQLTDNSKNDPGSSSRSNDPGSSLSTDNRQLITENHIKSLLLMLAPFAPHMTEELWHRLKDGDKDTSEVARRDSSDGGVISKDSIHLHPWPSFDPKYLVEDEVTIIVQVNGKTRDVIKVSSDKDTSDGGEATTSTPRASGKAFGNARPRWRDQQVVEEIARKSPKVQKYISGKTIKKTIFVPGRLINFVV